MLILILPAWVTSAQVAGAVKFAEFDAKVEAIEDFDNKLESFIQMLSDSPKSNRGFIAVADDDYQSTRDLRKRLRSTLKKRPEIDRRVGFTEHSVIYDRSWEVTEFWLLTNGADAPYSILNLGSGTCPDVSIHGKEQVSLTLSQTLVFTAHVSGGSQDSLEYDWLVDGGEITGGRGTPSIVVEGFGQLDSVNAKLRLTLGDTRDSANCQTEFTFTTKIRP